MPVLFVVTDVSDRVRRADVGLFATVCGSKQQLQSTATHCACAPLRCYDRTFVVLATVSATLDRYYSMLSCHMQTVAQATRRVLYAGGY